MSEIQVFGDVSLLTKDALKDLIFEIERLALRDGVPVEIPVDHHFSKDVYAREMVMPKGAMVIGKIHKHQNLCIISSGEVSVLSIDGVQRLKAPCTFVSSPGAKRVIYAHEETTWTVIHGTNETDVEKIEDQFIAKSYDEVVEIDSKKVEGFLCHG